MMEWNGHSIRSAQCSENQKYRARICFGFATKVDLGRIRFIILNCSCLLKINIEEDSIMLNNTKEVKQI